MTLNEEKQGYQTYTQEVNSELTGAKQGVWTASSTNGQNPSKGSENKFAGNRPFCYCYLEDRLITLKHRQSLPTAAF